VQRRPITAAHNFPTQNIRTGNGVPSLPMNGRWNNQSPSMGPPPHLQQPQSPTWNTSSIPHGFPATSYVTFDFLIKQNFHCFRSRRPANSLPNSNIPISQPKKGQNNYFPYLPPTTGQNQTSMRPTPAMGGNFLSSQNGQTPMNNGDMGQNFPSMNVNIQSY
jgi:hypothetical protein